MAKRIVVIDYTDYVDGKENNGGGYIDYITYTKIGRKWKVEYDSSADFYTCPCCGQIGDGYCNCNPDADDDYEWLYGKDLQKRLKQHRKNLEMKIVYK